MVKKHSPVTRDKISKSLLGNTNSRRSPQAEKQAKQRAWRARHRKRQLGLIRAIKTEKGCKECGENHPAALDFHHLEDKFMSVANMKQYSWRRVLEEIAKCEVMCSNCHRKKHWNAKIGDS